MTRIFSSTIPFREQSNAVLPISTCTAEAMDTAGFSLHVTTNTLLPPRVIYGHSVRNCRMSLTAATCVLIGLSASFNLAAAMIQIFWMTISVIGIALHLRRKRLHR